jgi:hypothetical protein
MAWLSAGNSNDDLVQQMIDNGVINSPQIQRAFFCTDRGDFVQPDQR